jgi:serine/threonine-protein kinase RsbW
MYESVSIKLPSKPEYVSIARLTASVLANNMGFNIEDIEDIKVAVGEACNNAIIHGKTEASDFDVTFHINATRFECEVKDHGDGINMEHYIEPDLSNPKVGGLGIFIMKSLMDQVEINADEARGTSIRMIKTLE